MLSSTQSKIVRLSPAPGAVLSSSGKGAQILVRGSDAWRQLHVAQAPELFLPRPYSRLCRVALSSPWLVPTRIS